MFKHRDLVWLVACTMAAFPVSTLAQSPDVSFLVMGKTSNHRQNASGRVRLLNYHFFAEIFVRDTGSVSGATLHFPDGSTQSFEDLSYVQEVHGGRYQQESELDAAYPNGEYSFSYDASGGSVKGRRLSIRGTGEGTSRIPEAPIVELSQGGAKADPRAVDPDQDLVVSWSGFSDAESDSNGIVDDLVFVVLGNCHGDKTVHSGRPFEGTDHLDYRTKSFTLPSDKLRPGEPHQIFVEHAKVDTTREDEVVGLVTYASTTFVDFRATGLNLDHPCPNPMLRIDEGQTDRPPRP